MNDDAFLTRSIIKRRRCHRERHSHPHCQRSMEVMDMTDEIEKKRKAMHVEIDTLWDAMANHIECDPAFAEKINDDELWDRAYAEADAVWAEKYRFLEALEVRGPATTPEQRKQDDEWLLEITERCHAKHKALFERIVLGYPPTN